MFESYDDYWTLMYICIYSGNINDKNFSRIERKFITQCTYWTSYVIIIVKIQLQKNINWLNILKIFYSAPFLKKSSLKAS